MASDIDRAGVAKAYERWAPVYDLVFGKVFDHGRQSTIAEADKDPAQLRNVVCQLARVKLQQEAALRDLPVSPLEMEHLTSALEIAIDRVETMSLKHDNPRVLQSGADESDVNGRDIVIAQPRKTNALPTFLRRDPFVGISRRDARPSRWPRTEARSRSVQLSLHLRSLSQTWP